ncbi:hypothetical protein KSP39_PZI020299 [Platanthera zijinensis]|uniref:Uncharacterized protein n=1 Tax=Platanthera zijinensis TaxID=2320716 RepID=A0AAP0AZ98_9ASPA
MEASKQLRRIKTPSNPDAVLHFLIQIGLDDAGIRNAVSRKPTLLCTKVEGTLKPKVRLLQQAGFSEPDIARLISKNPFFIHRKDFHVKIEFLGDLFNSKEDLLKAMIKSTYLLCSNLDKRIIPNVSYLRTCGLSKCQIGFLMKSNRSLITGRLESIKRAGKHALELGFTPKSGMFCFGLKSTCHMSRASIDAKIKAMMSFGFSEAEISSAILKNPQLLFLSVKNIKSKLNFFVNRAGSELSYIISHPLLLCFSLERRLIPRNHVLSVLTSKGLPKRKYGLFHIMQISDAKFAEKFILPHREELTDLDQVYLSACAGEVPAEDNFS